MAVHPESKLGNKYPVMLSCGLVLLFAEIDEWEGCSDVGPGN
jgi:hypothetical protein